MARKRIITPEKKELIRNLISEYNITSAKDLQEALKDLLGDTIQNMLEAELDEHLGYEKYESTEEAKSNYLHIKNIKVKCRASPECRIRAENCSQV